MKSFYSLDELVKMLDREKKLLQEMFRKRSTLSMRYDIALSLVDYRQDRLEALLELRIRGFSLDLLCIYI